jgi:hypothetical protein
MPAAITELREAIGQTVETEFAAEGLTVLSDKLHDSMGIETPLAGVFPEGERTTREGAVGLYLVSVQVFMRWDPQIDPAQIVPPELIEDWSWRLQRRMASESKLNLPNVSYYVVNDVIYPDDPTGNKTRFVMSLAGYGSNPALDETTP